MTVIPAPRINTTRSVPVFSFEHDRLHCGIALCVLFTTLLWTAAAAANQIPSTASSVTVTQSAVWMLQPSTTVIQAGQRQQFAAFVPEEYASAVTWTATGGAITRAGLYTAPPMPGTYVVKASVMGGALAASASVQVVATQGTTTEAADRFVDSVGVNVHLHYNGTLYRDNFELVKSRRAELGLRHVRDGLIDTTWQGYYERHDALGTAGIKGTFIISPGMSADLLQSYPLRVPRAFEAYEAPNEYDAKGGATWVETLRNTLLDLDHTTRIAPGLAGFPIYGPSLTRESSYSALGDVSAWIDAGNLHNYLAGRHPGTNGWGSNGYGSIDWNLRLVTAYSDGKPIVTTETGYLNDLSRRDSVPEAIAGKYLPRLLLEQYRKGIARTYLYELCDQPNTSSYGLIRTDGSRKPAFFAVANLLQMLQDPGPAITPQPLGYSITGASSDVRHMTFQQRSGTYYLAIWTERSGYDVNNQTALTVAPQTVTIAPTSRVRLVATHAWRDDGTVVHTTASGTGTLSVTVTDNLLMLELQPY